MLIITHHIKSASDFMDRYLPHGAAGGLFLPEKLGMPRGGRVCLELFLDWLGEVFFPVAVIERTGVVWDNGGRRLKGAVVRFADEEAPLRDHLLGLVQTSTGGWRPRGADRQAARLRALCYDADAHSISGEIRDLSPSGALLAAEQLLPAGSDVHLRLEDPDQGVMHHVRGRVVRLDFRRADPGMGVEFRFQSRRERKAMARLCQRLAERAA